ncbi:MAG: hypothetical protein AAF823_13715 [Planctomycetota bacterium]
MRRTLGVHLVKSAYGRWLPGDERGHWSSRWDAELGYVEPGRLHPGDPVRRRMAAEQMKHPPVLWGDEAMSAMVGALWACEAESDWSVAAMSVEPTHVHVLTTYSARDAEGTAKWLSQRMTKAVHAAGVVGPVFARGRWLQFVFDEGHWGRLVGYINRHRGAVAVHR